VIDTLTTSPLAQAIGLALVDFVWQGAAIAIATALLLAALRRSTADARYLAACLGLAAMALAPILTTTYYARGRFGPEADTALSASLNVTAVSAPAPAALATRETVAAAGIPESRDLLPVSWSGRLTPWLPTIVVLWIGGVAALSLNLLRGWIQIRRLLRHAAPMSASVWPTRMRLMAERLGVRRPVRLVKSARVDVPAVIGWLRPAIVVPMSVIAGLSPAYLDAILAHELSHIRRGDYLVNLVQCVVETLLFYHPGVWWLSRRIRIEREHCCDDLAASLCDSRLTYASALASLETLRAQSPALVMPATGGVLLHRIRRLVEPRWSSIPDFSGGFAMCVVATLLLLVGQVTATPPAGPPDVAVVQTPVAPIEPASEPRITEQAPPVQSAAIEGTVVDATGGTIPGATVTLTSAVSAATNRATTDPRGRFAFANLPPGPYDLAVSLTGFKTTRGRVDLRGGQRFATRIRLDIGSLTEEIHLRGTPLPTPADPNARQLAASGLFDAAKRYYEEGRLREAEAMTARALALVRDELKQQQEQLLPNMEPREQSGPIRVGGSIKEPRKTRDVPPVYPSIAQQARVQGYVIIEAVIGTDGRVKDARVLGGQAMLQEAALEAVKQWEYTPTLLNGVAVEVIMNVTVSFKLNAP
jgi:TonB family protein